MSRGDRKLPPGDYVFLAFLTLGSMSAYEIKKGMQGSVSHFWSTAHSQVYQQAARLVRDGCVRELEVPGGRRKRILSLTPKGRRAVTQWLRDPAAQDQLFSGMLVKLFFAAQAGDLVATKRMLEQQRQEFAETLATYEAFLPVLQSAEATRYPAMTLEFGIRFHREVVEWLDDTIARLEGDIAAGGKEG